MKSTLVRIYLILVPSGLVLHLLHHGDLNPVVNLAVTPVGNLAVNAVAHLAAVAPSRRVARVTTLPDVRIDTNGTTNAAKTETTIAGIVIMIVLGTGTMTAGTVIANAPVTAPAPPKTVIVMPRTTGRDAMTTAKDVRMTESAGTTERMSPMAKTGKVCH